MKVLHTSKQSARSQKENKYWSSTPCKHGHVGLRYARAGDCIACSKNITKRRYKEGQEFLVKLRATTPCADCNHIFDWRVMEFDHKEGRRSKGDYGVSGFTAWGLSQVKKELEKCDIVCGNCHNIRTQSRIYHPATTHKNALYVRNLRETTPCKDCGTLYPWPAMEFDHVRGEKKSTVSKLASSNGTTRLMEEISKCEIVCRNCHIIRTRERADKYCKWKTK